MHRIPPDPEPPFHRRTKEASGERPQAKSAEAEPHLLHPYKPPGSPASHQTLGLSQWTLAQLAWGPGDVPVGVGPPAQVLQGNQALSEGGHRGESSSLDAEPRV